MVPELPESTLDTTTDALVPTFAAVTTAQQDLHGARREVAIESARDLVPVTTPLFGTADGLAIEQLNDVGSISERELHRIRKVSEVYENRFRIRLPTSAIQRAAVTAGKFTTIGGIILALNGLHEAATAITETVQADGRKGVTETQVDDFYFASGVFIGELVLMATPFAANFAFQATGRLHSRLLWHRFKNPDYRGVYRLLLHHVYYVFKGIPSLTLHSLQDIDERVTSFVESVVFLIETTWNVFNEPAVLAEITAHEFEDGLLNRIREFSLDQLRDELGDAADTLEAYIRDILADLEDHYDSLYETHFGGRLKKRELITRILRAVIDRL